MVAVVGGLTPAPDADAEAGQKLIVDGRGAAHGYGLAMDGVLGQARAGWSHDRILDLFYPGTTPGDAAGTIRVGLAEERELIFELPSGGMLVDDGGGAGLPLLVPAGGRVVVRRGDGGLRVDVGGFVHAAQTEILPSPVPLPVPDRPPGPSATPRRTPQRTPVRGDGLLAAGTLRIVPGGDLPLTRLLATGRRYRGRMEVRPSDGGLMRAINVVDLEAYVAGIAEEKGQSWPDAGLEVLAVAARTLAAATMSWYGKNHHRGYHICPTGDCQLYLGYDGEEESMRRATQRTAGVIRTYDGDPILAMYHGNGAGRTETYSRFPYLRSVAYPFARPSRWRHVLDLDAAAGALSAGGIAVKGRLQAVEILERGDSPRVRKLRVVGSDGDTETTGVAFQNALGLRSTWFDAHVGRSTAVVTAGEVPVAAGAFATPPAPASEERPPWLVVLAAFVFAAAAGGTIAGRSGRLLPAAALSRRAGRRLRERTTSRRAR